MKSNTYKKEANILLSLVKENFNLLSGEEINVLDKNIIKIILENLNSDKNISNEYRDLIENISVKVTERQMEENLLGNKIEIEEILKKIQILYEKHNEQLTTYKQTIFTFKNENEESFTRERNVTMVNPTLATLANISSNSAKFFLSIFIIF